MLVRSPHMEGTQFYMEGTQLFGLTWTYDVGVGPMVASESGQLQSVLLDVFPNAAGTRGPLNEDEPASLEEPTFVIGR